MTMNFLLDIKESQFNTDASYLYKQIRCVHNNDSYCLSPGQIPFYPGWKSHKINTFFYVGVLRMNRGVSQPEGKGCSVVWWYITSLKQSLPCLTLVIFSLMRLEESTKNKSSS